MKASRASRAHDWIGSHGSSPESLEAAVAGELGVPPPPPPKRCPCGFVSAGSGKTVIEGRAVGRSSDRSTHGRAKITTGAAKVLEGRDRRPLARVGEKVGCGGVIIQGAQRTIVGGPSA